MVLPIFRRTQDVRETSAAENHAETSPLGIKQACRCVTKESEVFHFSNGVPGLTIHIASWKTMEDPKRQPCSTVFRNQHAIAVPVGHYPP